MSEEHDSWMQSALGIDIGSMVQKVESAGSALVDTLGSAVSGDAAPTPAPAATGDIIKADPETSKGLFDRLSDASGALKQKASEVVDGVEAASQKVLNAESGAYHTVTDAYDSVAPDNFTGKDWGGLVDKVEGLVKDGGDANNAEYADVPVVGSLVRAETYAALKATEYTGGLAKGFGDLAATVGNNVFHPIDQAPKIAGGFLDAAEHGAPPGIAMGIKGLHGGIDLLRGKTDGKYGGTLEELGENLLLDTQRDPTDPTKTVNTDVEYLASFGGGRKAWEDKPFEAAGRTVANIVPMLLGDEGPGVRPEEPVPRKTPPETPPPTVRDPVPPQFDPEHVQEPFEPSPSARPDTQRTPTQHFENGVVDTDVEPPKTPVDEPGPDTVRDPVPPQFDPEHVQEPFEPSPSAKPDTQRTPTQHFENGVVDTDVEPSKTRVDEQVPDTERDPTKVDRTPELAELRQAEIDALKEQQAALKESTEAVREYVEYSTYQPQPERNWPGKPEIYDPAVDEALSDRAERAEDRLTLAGEKLKDAQRAYTDALGRGNKKAGKPGGFGPPKR